MTGGRIFDEHLCPHFEDHTPAPEGYLQWHAWAKSMSRTHRSRKCPGCNLYRIWEPKTPTATTAAKGEK